MSCISGVKEMVLERWYLNAGVRTYAGAMIDRYTYYYVLILLFLQD